MTQPLTRMTPQEHLDKAEDLVHKAERKIRIPEATLMCQMAQVHIKLARAKQKGI